MEEFFENELAKKFEEMLQNNEEYYFDTEELEEIIIHYLELGDIFYAEQAVIFGLKLHPNSIEIKIKKLEVLIELEKYKEARQIIKELDDRHIEDTDFFICCAKYYSNLGHSKKAIDFCEKALEFKEEINFLHNFIADEYSNLNDPFSALKHYKLALEADQRDDYVIENIMYCYSLLNKPKEAISFLNNYLDSFSFSEIAWFEYGQFYYNQKKYEEAIKGYDYLLAINTESVGVYSNKAACYEAMKQWQKAIEVYHEMLQIEYTKAFTYYKIGLCHKELKQPIVALGYFQKSLKEDPQFYLSMMEQSYIYEELGGNSEALYFAKEATSLNENNLEYHKRLAFLYINNGSFEESLLHLKKLIDSEPGRFYNWYAYTEVLMLLGEYEEAKKILYHAIRKHKKAELYYQLSNCYFNLKDEIKGQEVLQQATELNPNLLEEMGKKYPVLKNPQKTTPKKLNK